MSMRRTQLDSSIPRAARGAQQLAPGETPKVNYLPPLIVTLVASIAVVLFMALITWGFYSITTSFFNPGNGAGPSIIGGGFCGLVFLLCAAATVYFLWAVIKVVRDLFTPLQIRPGLIVNRRSSRGGAYWISVDFGDQANSLTQTLAQAPVSSNPPPVTADTTAPLSTTSGTTARPVDAKGFGGSFGSQLDAATRSEDTVDDGPPRTFLEAELEGEEIPVPKGRALRVDKHVFESLAVGDNVNVAFSRYIEHVYYVQRIMKDDTSLLLRNLSLI